MISVCSPQLGLADESNSGGEVYDREVIKRLCDKGVRVLTLLPKGRSFLPHDNLEAKYALIRPMTPPHVFNAFVLPYLIKTYLTHRFDLLRVHNPYFVGPAAAVFKKIFPRVPVVASYLHLESGLNQLIDRIVIKAFDHIITISQSTKKEINKRLGYPKNKITVAYPGVDERFQPGSKPKNKFTMMYLGGLKKRKNPGFLLKVLAQLKRKDIVLVYAGTGPLLNYLKQKTKDLSLTNQVHFTGYIPEKDKVRYYQMADVVMLPSLKEGFGMTLTEAGACGLPTIGANHYSIKEIIINGKTGFLARPNDVNDWADKLLQLIKSPQLCQKMGDAGRKFVTQTFTWEKNLQIHVKIFNQLIQKG